jgi:ribosomal protein S6E (S10)
MAISRFLLTLCLSVVLFGCGGGGGPNSGIPKFGALVPVATMPTPLFTSAPDTILLRKGAIGSYLIGGGTKPYRVSSSDPAQVNPTVVDGELTLTAVGVGSATVVITDETGGKLRLSVAVGSQVPMAISAPSAVNLLPGEVNSQTYLLSGGVAPYTVTSGSPSIVGVLQPSGSTIKVTGLVVGAATVTVQDSANPVSVKSFSVNVTGSASAPLTVSPLSVTGTVGETVKFKIQGGSGAGYSVVSVNESIAVPSLTGSVVSVSLASAGQTKLIVEDSLGQAATVDVVANVMAGVPLYTSAPDSVTMSASTQQVFVVGGGTGNYVYSSSNTGVATVTPSGSLVVSAIASGQATITVTDSGTTRSFIVIVGSQGPLITSAPAAVSLVPNGVPAGFQVYGGKQFTDGTAPYRISTNNDSVAGVTSVAADGTYAIVARSVGTAIVTLSDQLESKQITVTVAESGVNPLTVLPGAASGSVGDTLIFNINGGKEKSGSATLFDLSVNKPSVAFLDYAGGRRQFSLQLLATGQTTVEIIDGVGQVATLDIAVVPLNSNLRLSPSELYISEIDTGAVELSIFGGSGTYSARTSDGLRTSVGVAGNLLVVSPAIIADGATRFCFNPATTSTTAITTPITATVHEVILTVTDTAGKSATSTLKLVDSGGCNP